MSVDAAEATVPARSQPARLGGVFELAALAAMIAAGLAAWALGVLARGYDYDEVLRAHSIWLTSQGLRPYTDFFEVHPPYFVLLSPVFRAFADPVVALRALRLVAFLGNLVFLTGLVAVGGLSLAPGQRNRWPWFAVALIAFNPLIVDFLVEFRIDGWGYGIIVLLIHAYCRRPRTWPRIMAFGGCAALASALFAPKMVLLPPLLVVVDQVAAFTSWRGLVRAGAAYVAGLALAAAGFVLYLVANGIGLDRTLLMLGRYHAVSNARAGFGFGLLQLLLFMRVLLALVLAGGAVWAVRWARGRTPWSPYPPALAVWLVLQAVMVTYPYKQYYASWFLFATGLVPPLGSFLANRFRGAGVIVCLFACVASVYGSGQIARIWNATRVADADNELIRWMNRVAGPRDRVVGSPPYHPIDRYDTFFLSFNTTDPKGFDSERIFAELPGLRRFVTPERYRAELEAHPPALVVLESPLMKVEPPAVQGAVVSDYMRRHDYRKVRVGVVWFALRPDRYDFARRNGYIP